MKQCMCIHTLTYYQILQSQFTTGSVLGISPSLSNRAFSDDGYIIAKLAGVVRDCVTNTFNPNKIAPWSLSKFIVTESYNCVCVCVCVVFVCVRALII